MRRRLCRNSELDEFKSWQLLFITWKMIIMVLTWPYSQQKLNIKQKCPKSCARSPISVQFQLRDLRSVLPWAPEPSIPSRWAGPHSVLSCHTLPPYPLGGRGLSVYSPAILSLHTLQVGGASHVLSCSFRTTLTPRAAQFQLFMFSLFYFDFLNVKCMENRNDHRSLKSWDNILWDKDTIGTLGTETSSGICPGSDILCMYWCNECLLVGCLSRPSYDGLPWIGNTFQQYNKYLGLRIKTDGSNLALVFTNCLIVCSILWAMRHLGLLSYVSV